MGEPMMDYTLPASAGRLRGLADAFVLEALGPRERGLPPAEGALSVGSRHELDAWRGAAGLWGLGVPADLGGMGLGWLERALVQERVQRSPLGLWPHGALAAGDPPLPLLAAEGPARARHLQPCLEGRRVAHQLLLDGHGWAGGVAAVPTADGAVLAGHCAAVPALLAEDILLLVAPLQGRLQGFVCDADLEGYRVTRRRPGMGAAELVDISWEGCLLDAARILPTAGPAALLWRAGQRAAVLGAGALGAAERCLEMGLEHVRRRQTFGRPLADRQAIQWMLADSARELHGARLLAYRAASLADTGDAAAADRLAGPAKALAAESALRVVDRVLQMHGGYGYTRDLPFERFWRDLRFYRLAEGADGELIAAAAADLLAELDAWTPAGGAEARG